MTELPLNNTLIVGGTGMLAEVSRFLALHSTTLTLAARHPENLARELGATAVTLDWADPEQAVLVVRDLPEFDLIVSWLHDDGAWLAEHLEALLLPGGRSIRVHGAASRDATRLSKRNTGSRPDIMRQTVILGWVNGPAGKRWLQNPEICAGITEAIKKNTLPVVVVGTLEGKRP